MKSSNEPPMRAGRPPFSLRFLCSLSQPLWTPEPDEKRFLAGLPVTLVLILFLWRQNGADPLGGYAIPASFALWCAAYVIKFRQRLQARGQFKRAILAPAVFVALLLGARFY